jgi:membrane protein
MSAVQRLASRADKMQQRRPWLAVPVATWKKFSDDRAGSLAALVAYYAFVSLLPLLLVLVSVLDLLVRNNAALRDRLLDSALQQYPLIGAQLRPHVEHGLSGTGFALVTGIVIALYGARGVANAIQNSLNTVWAVPIVDRPRFPWSLLRGLGLIATLGPGQIITITLSGLAGGAGHIGGAAGRVAAIIVALLLNVGLFWLAFRIATARQIPARDFAISAVLSAVAWQILQLVGGYFVGHQLKSHSAYGVFAVVLGLLAWLYLQAQITLYVAEYNVVRVRGLWPRTLNPPPLNEPDVLTYRLAAKAGQRRPELAIDVRPTGSATADPPPQRQQ